MKKFEKIYKDYLNNINLTSEEKIEIKEKVTKNNKNIFIFKFVSIPTIFISMLFISGILVVTANSVARYFKVQENKSVMIENDKLNIDCNSDVFNKKTIFTHEELENLFGIKILKNSKINSNLYKLSNIKSNGEKVASIYFNNVSNKDSWSIDDINIGFGFKTKYFDWVEEEPDMWISGPRDSKEVKYYYIKSLDTQAVIVEAEGEVAPIMTSFVYNDVVYFIDTNKASHTLEDVYRYFDSYSK